MNRTFKAAVAALILAVGFAGSVPAGPLWAADWVPVDEPPAGLTGPLWDAETALYERDDYATALRLMRPIAEQGNARAQFLLGSMAYYGQGVPQDYATAISWWRKAAAQGDADALVALGRMYDEGPRGGPHDSAAAASWFRIAAERGDARAQYHLADMYLEGRGVPQDYVLAHMWFNLVAANGAQLGAEARDEVASKMTPAQIAEAQKLAREWKPKLEGVP
jgi:TPR repeat protein